MPIVALRLKVRRVRPSDARAFIPVETKPTEAVENAGDHLDRGALGIGVFDAEDERAAMPARVEPVEERGARAPDVEIARGRWRKTDTGNVP
jgi:hypothetical protein